MTEEDAREVELSTIAAIYPELAVDENDPYSVSIDLPVCLARPLVVSFPAATEAAPPINLEQPVVQTVNTVDSQELSNLPPLRVQLTLPEGYPLEKPPVVHVSTSPSWLSKDVLDKLESKLEQLWEDLGRDQVVFTYIDDVQQSAENVFGLVDEKGTLEVEPEHKIALLDFDIRAKRAAFEKETFECGICLDPKKGSVCHKMLDCGHVFCVQCLQDFYNNAITEGDVAAVKCLEPSCADEREKAHQKASGGKVRKLKTFISPSELLQIPLEQDMVKRYVALKHKTELESDKNTIYCPRSWCQGAARSKKHKKPEGLEFTEQSDEESDQEAPDNGQKSKTFDRTELLAICEDCYFAFCSRCGQSWHGEFKYCVPKERKEEISEEEMKSMEYLKLHTTPCPTCAAPCQKTHGCNHMRCFRCQTHFCYLCSAWLSPDNPYRHFNTQDNGNTNSCYMRLWELEGGDGDDVGINYEGGPNAHLHRDVDAGPEQAVQAPAAAEPLHEIFEDDLSEGGGDQEEAIVAEAAARAPDEPQGHPDQPNGRVAIAREGPLVLRIEGNAPPADRAAVVGGRQQQQQQQQQQPRPRPLPQRQLGGGRGRQGGNRGPQAAQNHGRRGGHQDANRNRNRAQRQNHQNNNAGRHAQAAPPIAEAPGDDQLNQADADWVRHFVQLALNDQEHLLEWDSDEE